VRTHVGSYLWGVRGKLGMLGVRPNLFQGTTRLFVALCLLISGSIQHRSLPRRRRRVQEPPWFHRVAIEPTSSGTGLFCRRRAASSWCTSEAVAICVGGAPEGHWQSVTRQ